MLFTLKKYTHILQSSLHFFSTKCTPIKQWGMNLHISQLWWHPKLPCQQARRSTTFLVITHFTPRAKTKPHNSIATGQCNNKRSTVPSSLLHIWHLLTEVMLRFHRFFSFSIVRIFPKAATQRKKATLLRTSRKGQLVLRNQNITRSLKNTLSPTPKKHFVWSKIYSYKCSRAKAIFILQVMVNFLFSGETVISSTPAYQVYFGSWVESKTF